MATIDARIKSKADTTAHWNDAQTFVPMRGEIIIYTDHGQIEDSQGNLFYVPGIKVGDGSTYVGSLPFVNADVQRDILDELRTHKSNTNVHVSLDDKSFWNNKLNCTVSSGNLILNRS